LNQEKGKEVTGVSGTLSQRRYPKGTEMAYVLIVYNAKTEGKDNRTSLEIMARILKGDRVVYNSQLKPVEVLDGSSPPSRIITGGILRLLGLAPDDYTLEVTVIDKLRKKGSAVARQEIDFSVE